jgi:hypothetical protein
MTSAHAVARLVETLRYKPESHWFDSRWSPWNSSLTLSFRPHYSPGVNSNTNRNDHLAGKGGRCAGLTTLPPPRVDRLEISGASTSWNPHGLSRPEQVLLYIHLLIWRLSLSFPEEDSFSIETCMCSNVN